MSAIRLLIVTIFVALLAVLLGNGRNIQAAPTMEPEMQSVTRPFDHIANERLAVTASGADGCQTVAQDQVQYRFDLPVTTDVRDDLVAALSGGGTIGVAFQTETTFLIEGSGSAGFTADFNLIIFDDSSGSETVLKTWQVEKQAIESGPATERHIYLLTESALDQLQVGDILRVQGTAQAVARSGGCQSTDRAATVTKPVDKATPLLYASFTNCDSLGLAGTAYVTGLNCRLVALEEVPRAYLVYVPETVQEPVAPVVFMFHGSSGNGSQYYNISGWTQKADDEGFYAVYPTALKYCNRSADPESCNWATKWNSYKLPEEEGFDFDVRPPGDPDKEPDWRADDVEFTRTMLADLEGAGGLINVDPDRVYASGFSNGASFVGRLAVEMADQFAAVAYSSGGLVSVTEPENLPLPPLAHIPVYATFGSNEIGVMEEAGWDPLWGELPLEPPALLAVCGLVDYFIQSHLSGLEHAYDPDTFWPFATLENEHSTLFRWDSSRPGDPEHLFLLGAMAGVTHTYPKGYDAEKNPHAFVAADIFWDFFQDPLGYFEAVPTSPDAMADFPECPADPPTGDYGDAPDDSNTPGINPNTAYPDTGVSGSFPTTWPSAAPAGPVHFATTVFLGDDFSMEAAADVGPDPDGANNIVDGPADNADNDAFDDGWLNPEALFPHCQRTTLKVRVSRASLAAGGEEVPNQMYLNVWFDGNRDGDWQDRMLCSAAAVHPWAAEWIVRNRPVNAAAIAPGGFVDATVTTFRVPNQAEDLSHWLRFTLSETPMPTPAGQMPDGRGPQAGYDEGETEDYEYEPPAVGAPGDLVVTQEIDPVGPFVPGQVTDVAIGLEHVGGDGPAASQIRSVLPAGLSFVGPIGVEVEGQGAAPLLATYDEKQGLISWDGLIAPNSTLRISFPVRVGACYADIQRPIIIGASALGSDGYPIAAESTLTVNCSPATIDDISVERKLFAGDQQVMPGDDGRYVILDGAPDPVTLQTSVTNNSPGPVLLGLVDVLEYHEGGLKALDRPAMEPAVEKVERVILLPIFGGETRTFTENDPLSLVSRSGAASFGEAEIVSRLTYCLSAFKDQTCPDLAGNAGLVAEDGPINMRFARRDLGDAPDGSNNFAQPMTAYPGVPANFPTVRNPAAGLPPGPVHIAPRPFHLGQWVSLEVEADIGPDQDLSNNILPLPNVANRDRADDGIRPGLLVFTHCQPVTFQARVFIGPAAVAYYANQDADGLAYLNAWLDGNGDGDWADVFDCPPEAPEHIVIDQVIDPIALGAGLHTVNVTSGPVPWAGNDCAWLRLTLSDRPAEKPLAIGNVSYGDGRGAADPYLGGETEDHQLCPGGLGAPDLDIQAVARPVFPPAADTVGTSGDALMEAMRHFELLATIANLGSATAEGAKLNVTLGEGYAFTSVTLPHVDGMRFLAHCSAASECSIDLDDLEPGESGALYMQVSGLVVTGPAPTAQFEIVNSNDILLSNNSVTLPLEQGQPLFAPIINWALCNNEVVEGCFEFMVQGTAQPGSTVEATLERLDPAGQLSGETTAGPDGLWSLTFDNVPPGKYRAYAVTRSGDQRSPRSNTWRWDIGPMQIPVVRLTDEAGRERLYNPKEISVDRLVPGETYQIAARIGSADPEVQLSFYLLPEISDEVLLLDEDGDGIYTGQFTVPADPGAQVDTSMEPAVFYLVLLSGGAEVINQGQVIIDDAIGRVFDSETGRPLSTAAVTALEIRPGRVHSRSLALRQPWLGVPFNHPNPLSTGVDGAYRFQVPEGEYHLRVSQPGYQPFLSPLISCASPLCGGVLSEPLGLTREIAGPAAAVLTIADKGIYPATVTIRAGQVVEWVNMDLGLRGVAQEAPIVADGLMAGGDWDSGLLEPGQSYKRRFSRSGVYTIFDETNPANSMTVVVEDATVFLPIVVK